jgi:hypothetical protein
MHAYISNRRTLPSTNFLTETKSRIFIFSEYWVQGSPLPREVWNPRRVPH